MTFLASEEIFDLIFKFGVASIEMENLVKSQIQFVIIIYVYIILDSNTEI